MQYTAPKPGQNAPTLHSHLNFPGTLDSICTARTWAAETLTAHGIDTPLWLPLVVSELATNAITHTRSGALHGHYTLRVAISSDRIRVEVRDAGPLPGRSPTRVWAPGSDPWPGVGPRRNLRYPVGEAHRRHRSVGGGAPVRTVHYRIPPRPTLDAHRALHQIQDALQALGLTPDPRAADWSVDARLYAHRGWEQRKSAAHGSPVAAVCLRLHQPDKDRLWWLYETPARGVSQWATPDPIGSHRRLVLLADATRALHPASLAPVRLLHRRREPHMLTRIGFAEARVRAARLGWMLTRQRRAVLGWVYLLAPPDGQSRILYDLNTLDSHLPGSRAPPHRLPAPSARPVRGHPQGRCPTPETALPGV